MIDIGSAIALGLSGFLAGVAYANRSNRSALDDTAAAGAVIIGRRAYVLSEMVDAWIETVDDPEPTAMPDNVVPIGERRGDAA